MRAENRTREFKHFKVADVHSEVAMETARAAAKRWVECGGDMDTEDAALANAEGDTDAQSAVPIQA